ncbi:hypothetical protein L1049_018724 [Liquidambar formosana]|uniref:Uncharacterized protein n=1 Tax=Liquidambar formosana TaxID=63359 RepID=A0AAP0RAG4_LIQFO
MALCKSTIRVGRLYEVGALKNVLKISGRYKSLLSLWSSTCIINLISASQRRNYGSSNEIYLLKGFGYNTVDSSGIGLVIYQEPVSSSCYEKHQVIVLRTGQMHLSGWCQKALSFFSSLP